jgi:hypothetical protein
MPTLDAQSQYLTDMHRRIAAATDGMSLMSAVDMLEGPVFDALPQEPRDELWHHMQTHQLSLLRKTGAGTP